MWYLSVDESTLIQSDEEQSADLFNEISEKEAMNWLEAQKPQPEPGSLPPVYSNEQLSAAMLALTQDL